MSCVAWPSPATGTAGRTVPSSQPGDRHERAGLSFQCRPNDAPNLPHLAGKPGRALRPGPSGPEPNTRPNRLTSPSSCPCPRSSSPSCRPSSTSTPSAWAHIPLPPLPQHPAAMAGVSERARRVAAVITRRSCSFSWLVRSRLAAAGSGSGLLCVLLEPGLHLGDLLSWSSMIFWAISLVTGSLACFRATLAMATAPLWWGIMWVRKSTSGLPV